MTIATSTPADTSRKESPLAPPNTTGKEQRSVSTERLLLLLYPTVG